MKALNKRKIASGVVLFGAAAITVTTVVFAAGGGPGGGGGGGAQRGGGQMEVAERSASVINVKLQTPMLGDIVRTTDFIGKIEPGDDISVYPEASGKIAKVYYDAGQTVRAGDLLMQLDTSDLEFALEKAEASYQSQLVSANKTLGSDYTSKIISAQNSLDKANRSYRTARKSYATEVDIEDDDLEKADNLRNEKKETKDKAYSDYLALKKDTGLDYEEDDAVKELWTAYQKAYQEYVEADDEYYYLTQEYDESTSAAAANKDNAYKDVQQAKESLELTAGTAYDEEKAVIEAQLKSASLNLTEAERNLNKAYLYAPISGTIESCSVDDYGIASTNSAAFTISNVSEIQVAFNASSDGAAALSLGDEITVMRGDKTYTATITEIDTKADESTGLFPIKANIQETDGTLLSGISVKVTAATAKAENALLIPQDVIYYDEGQAYVFTYADGKANRVDIQTGLSNADTVVVESGLSENDQVITTWHPDLADGVEVHLTEQAIASITAAGGSVPESELNKTADASASRPGASDQTPDAAAPLDSTQMPVSDVLDSTLTPADAAPGTPDNTSAESVPVTDGDAPADPQEDNNA